MRRNIPITCSISFFVVWTDLPLFLTLYRFVFSTKISSISSVRKSLKYCNGVFTPPSDGGVGDSPVYATSGALNFFFFVSSFLVQPLLRHCLVCNGRRKIQPLKRTSLIIHKIFRLLPYECFRVSGPNIFDAKTRIALTKLCYGG